MLNTVIKKIKNKKWLTVCLLLGLAFLVAAFCCQPMFKEGSMNMLLKNSFNNYIEENNQYPTVIGRSGAYSKENCSEISVAKDSIDSYIALWDEYLSEIDVSARQTIFEFEKESSQGGYGSKGNYLSITYIPEMTSHIEIVKGEDFDTYQGMDGYYPCIISEKVMDEYGLIAGETLNFVSWEDSKGNTLKLVIAGIFKESDSTDLFWYVEPNELSENVFVSAETFDYIMANYEYDSIYYNHYTLLDYTDINSHNIDDIQYYLNEFIGADGNFTASFMNIIEMYQQEKKTVDVLLWVLELPILGMVLAFIYMVSKQIVETEKNEISMFKSRGLSKKNIVLMYGVQSGILALLSLFVGIPMGYMLCKMAAGTTDFLTFSFNNTEEYKFAPIMILYGLIAALVGVIFILVPVVFATRMSIVEFKSMNVTNKPPVWKKCFFDVILLGISIYLLYSFNQDKDSIRQKAIEGSKMDPMIFLNSLLFIIGLGLVVLRLTHYLVKLIYVIGRKKWKPAVYASFLQIIRTTSRQGFISVFLILTVALGLFNANTARTINRNNEERIEYEVGTDALIQEHWDKKIYIISKTENDYDFIEPDYNRYDALVQDGLCESITRVIKDDKATVYFGNSKLENCVMLRGINTKEFGETAKLKDELNGDTHWFNYLNSVALNPNGVIISSSLAEELEVGIGDRIRCSRKRVVPNSGDDVRGSMTMEVCAIVDNWPGYDRYYYQDGELKENYLVVANYAIVAKVYRISPYEIWMNLSEGVSIDDVYAYLEEKNINMEYSVSVEEDILTMKNTPLIQITNGMFTMSFIIALVLCAVGFLIYWISSIRQRELLFGVYRAMGMEVKDVNKMLINEHIFSTFLSVLAGGGVGILSTFLFVRLFGIVYLPEKHNLDINIYFELGDIVKLAVVIAVMILVCIVVLRKLIKSLNITQALKLGEE